MTIHVAIERRGMEMTGDPRFRGRVRRLAITSGVALLLGGWPAMFTVLTLSLARPSIRRLVVVPAVIVTTALIGICLLELPSSALARAGWLALTAGILMGGGMGAWFWYRWIPVPRTLHDPYAPSRLALIAAHVGLVVGGIALILADRLI